MVDIDGIITFYYGVEGELRSLLETHSLMVWRKAEQCVANRGLDVDMAFVREACMLHDIGIVDCHAPAILCNGEAPYICHGVIGREMLSLRGLERHGLVCERHTGSGLTCAEIKSAGLPLPHRDMLPLSVEERLICYADKFYSKSGDATAEKSLAAVREDMSRFGDDVVLRFEALHREFG